MLRIITTLLVVACCHGYQLPRASVVGNNRLYVPTVLNFENEGNGEAGSKSTVAASGRSYYKDEAARLRQEAAELELALREEAREKGLPEEVINKLLPIRQEKSTTDIKKTEATPPPPPVELGSESEIRSKLGYLNIGDAVRFTSELERIKSRGYIKLWNSVPLTNPNYDVNDYQLKAKTSIDAKALKLDDVGYEYQKVFVLALGIATVCGLGSSFIGGQIGFILGYLSALVPVILVGVGSIAPALIGDVINRVRYTINSEAKDRYIKQSAAKFFVGYMVGLPLTRFDVGGISNTCEFFQLRPKGRSEIEDKQMFAKKNYNQNDISRSSIVCLAGSVAECIEYGSAEGTTAADVNVLNELIGAVEPGLAPEKVQNHIRWSALQAYEILKNNKEKYDKVVAAFRVGTPLEECIAIMECK